MKITIVFLSLIVALATRATATDDTPQDPPPETDDTQAVCNSVGSSNWNCGANVAGKCINCYDAVGTASWQACANMKQYNASNIMDCTGYYAYNTSGTQQVQVAAPTYFRSLTYDSPCHECGGEFMVVTFTSSAMSSTWTMVTTGPFQPQYYNTTNSANKMFTYFQQYHSNLQGCQAGSTCEVCQVLSLQKSDFSSTNQAKVMMYTI